MAQGLVAATRPGQLRWFAWPGEDCFSIFDDGTGLTHLVDAASAATLRLLCAGPADLDALADRLAAQWGAAADTEWRALVKQSVDGLAALQLIDYSAPPV